MAFRFAVLLVVSLAVAAAADAACLTCIRSFGNDGFCGPSDNGRCSYTCCLWDEGTPCSMLDNTYGCGPDDPLIVPSLYFATKLPLVTEGSALRLRLGKGQPVQRKCGAALLARMTAKG